jgi:type IV pilus assembly protein PilB
MVDLDLIEPSPEILGLIPKALAVKVPALPLGLEDGTIVCAVPEGTDGAVLGDIEFVAGRRIRSTHVPREPLARAVSRLYLAAAGNGESCAPAAYEPATKPGEFQGATVSEGSAVTMANTLISDAVRMGASDIHVEPYEAFVRIRYRLDGVLQEVSRPSVAAGRTLISRLKIMADLDIAEKRRPQDGRIRVKEDGRTIDIRVSTLPTDFGEKVVLRILDKSRLRLDLSKLGFEEEDLKTFKKALKLPHGMILVTGPTGSGKTMTLYAALNFINSPGINITTIEDPIEYNLPGINQTHVRSDIGLTFAAALRSILRQDPNVVMVGEIRDGETAEIAVRAALTGHLVLSTLHTNDAPSAITRLVDMGVEPFLVAASVKMILAQRLLRRICQQCKVPANPTAEQRDEMHLLTSTQFWRGTGCPACGQTGFKGRMAAYEILKIENSLADLVARRASVGDLLSKAGANGFRSLRQMALVAAEKGVTTLAEVLRETG